VDLAVISMDGRKAGAVALSENAFSQEFNEALVHQVVTAYLAGGRSGSKAQKTRSEVRGGGTKPWRQKGTGRARAGTIRSPLWRSGGTTFAARPRGYRQKVNRKAYRQALRSILSELLRQKRLHVVKELSLAEPKTRDLAAILKKLDLGDVLLVTHDLDRNLALAARNLPYVEICEVRDANPLSLIRHQNVLMTTEALKQFEERLAA